MPGTFFLFTFLWHRLLFYYFCLTAKTSPAIMAAMRDITLSNVQVVILAVYALGGEQGRIDTEDVAIKANEIAPGRFAWRKYPDQIRLEHIRVRLGEAKTPKHGECLVGNVTQGWRLTPKGLNWATKYRDFLDEGVADRRPVDREMERRRRLALERMAELPAWQKFQNGEGVSHREAETVFRVSGYQSSKRRADLIDRLCNLFVGDPELEPFLSEMARLLGEEQEEGQ